MVAQFRNCLNWMALDKSHYFPIAREVRGLGNITSGVMQIAVGNCMKYSSNEQYRTIQSGRHITRGHNVLRIGLMQFLPGFLVAASVLVTSYAAYLRLSNRVDRPT